MGRRRWTEFVAGLAVAGGMLVFAAGARAGDSVYWANGGGAGHISFVGLDGTGGGDLNTTGAKATSPAGVAIDPAAGRIYWANAGTDRIAFARLDGSGGGDLNTTGATLNLPVGVSVDAAAGRIYWTNTGGGGKISFARLDGTGGGDLNTAGATVNGTLGVAVDAATGRVYWSNVGVSKISFARLDGTGGGDVPTTGATLSVPAGVAIDAAAGRIYWPNFGASKISFARLEGTGGGDLPTIGATISAPEGVAIDAAAGRIYWASTGAGGKLSFARLDGTGGGDLTTSGATVGAPTFPALLKAPASAAAPTVTGGATTGSTLTCSTGNWAADLTPAFLFRAPETFAYRWTLDGGDLAGATSSTLQANAPGAYRCQVTATNHAGAAVQASETHAIATPAVTPTTVTPATVPPLILTGLPSNRFTVGKLKGTTLSVTVESTGTLTVGDATTTARTARRGKRKRAGALLKPTTATGGPGVITIKLALTRGAAKTLKHKHKLTINARITFIPTGGATASTTSRLTVRTAKRHRRVKR